MTSPSKLSLSDLFLVLSSIRVIELESHWIDESDRNFDLFFCDRRFAAEMFHDLHEEVMATASRSHGLMARVQQLEAEFPFVEKALLCQTDHSPFFSNKGQIISLIVIESKGLEDSLV